MSVEEGGGQTQKEETSSPRYLITHKENHTIGLGEIEQLDLNGFIIYNTMGFMY